MAERQFHKVVMLLAKSYKIDTRVRNEAESLVAANYKVTVLTWDRFGYHSADTLVSGVRVISWRLLSGSEFSKIGYAVSAVILQLYCIAWCLLNVKQRFILHCNDFNTLPAGVFLRLVRPGSTRLVYDCHELTPSAYAEWYGYKLGLIAGALERRLIKFADRVITVSPAIKNYLSSISYKQITVIYNTISVQSVPRFDRVSWRKKLGIEGFVVAYVGLLRQDVGLDELIDAAEHFRDAGSKHIRFLIVGDGPDLPRIKLRAETLQDYVFFVPRVPHSEALGYVAASDISYAVYRSRIDSASNEVQNRLIGGNTLVASPWKIFEAMACGTCVMVRGGTFTWQFVNKIGYGLSAGYGTPAEIYRELLWAFDNQGKLELMASTAKQHFLNEYNWEVMSAVLVTIYDSLAKVDTS